MIYEKKDHTRKLRKQLSVWLLPVEARDIQQWSSWRTLQAYVLSWFRIFKWEPYEPLEFVCMSVCLGLILPCHSQAYLFRAGIFRFIMNKNTPYAEYSGANNTKKETGTMA